MRFARSNVGHTLQTFCRVKLIKDYEKAIITGEYCHRSTA